MTVELVFIDPPPRRGGTPGIWRERLTAQAEQGLGRWCRWPQSKLAVVRRAAEALGLTVEVRTVVSDAGRHTYVKVTGRTEPSPAAPAVPPPSAPRPAPPAPKPGRAHVDEDDPVQLAYDAAGRVVCGYCGDASATVSRARRHVRNAHNCESVDPPVDPDPRR